MKGVLGKDLELSQVSKKQPRLPLSEKSKADLQLP
jgi:hypothetical protein